MQVVHHCPEPPSVKAPHLPWLRIYALSDPRTGEVRFVGTTRYSIAQRLYQHLTHARAGAHTAVSRWLQELLSLGLRPCLNLLSETLDDADEVRFIQLYGSKGLLLNDEKTSPRGPFP